MPKQKPNYEERKCYICGGDTYKNISGKIYWFNDKDKNGYKTGRYICYYCYFGIGRHSPNYDNSGIKVCDICKNTKTFTRSDGKEYWYNHRDENYLKT
jgi:hypothetical protein